MGGHLMAQQEPAKRSMPYVVRLVLVIGAVVAGLVIAAKMGIVGNTAAPATARPAAVPPASSAPAVPAGAIGDGVWLVGTDVQPGTYRSDGASGGQYCMWSRHSSTAGGPLDNIIASDGSSAGQMVVTIAPGDKLFRTHKCGPFVKI
jgi:hypothetical protein